MLSRLPPVASLKLLPHSMAVTVPFAISRETLPRADILLVSVSDAEGRVGVGECAPFPSLTFDTVDAAESTARALFGECVRNRTPWESLARLDGVRDEAFRTSRTAFVGLETALLDLHARQLAVPLAALFGQAFVPEVESDITLPIMRPADVPDFWDRYRSYAFRTVKIKVSGNVSSDLDMIHALVAAEKGVTEDLVLTLDGNQGYAVDDARKLLAELSRHDIRPKLFEQPLPKDDWEGLAALSASVELPVCLDETIETAADALRAIHERAGRMINLKIMKSGVREAARILGVARAGGLELMIGGMLESEVAMGTSLQLAAGAGGVGHFDLDTPFFLERRVTHDSPWHPNKARLRVPFALGHGLQLV